MDSALREFKAQLKLLEANPANGKALSKAADLLTQIKIQMIQINFPAELKANRQRGKQLLTVAREALERATFYSIIVKDIDSFTRHIAQVKSFYIDFSSDLLESERKKTILGLNLMYLLAYGRLSEFHTELELIPVEERKDIYISYPIEVEQRLMEGSYSKVRALRGTVPSNYYTFFMNTLVTTVRERISECSMKAYESMPVSEGKKLLQLETDQKLKEHADKNGWDIKNQTIFWNNEGETQLELKSQDLVKENLAFATELERIV